MTDLRAVEIAAAIVQIEALGPDVAWSFGTITNDQHIASPIGRGVCVVINGVTLVEPIKPVTVFEKGRTFAAATSRAIARYHRRAAGDAGA